MVNVSGTGRDVTVAPQTRLIINYFIKHIDALKLYFLYRTLHTAGAPEF